jgi:uncharacterized Zn finger protein (UPF0148 family)
MENKKLYDVKCPVCGETIIPEEGEICPVCGWEHDMAQLEDPDLTGGANEMSLNQYRKWFASQRAKNPKFNWDKDHIHPSKIDRK